MDTNTNALAAHLHNLNARTLAWVAESPTTRWAACLVEELQHWAGYGITTPAQLDHYLLVTDVFEATRSVWGYKPDWSALNEATDEYLKVELERLAQEQHRKQEGLVDRFAP